MNLEAYAIKKLIETGDFTTITDMQISRKYFTGRYKKAFGFISKHVLNYGNVPSLEVFKKEYSMLPLPAEAPESLVYYCDTLRKKLKHNTIVEGFEEAQGMLEDLHTDEAYKLLMQTIMKVENEILLTSRLELNKDTNKRLDNYHKRAIAQGMTGIPFGIDVIDRILGGANDGELIAFLGYTGTGKSWLLVIIAVLMAKAGYRVFFGTIEMSDEMVMRRIDAVWNLFSYSRFRRGQLHPKELKKYENYLEEMEGNEEYFLVVETLTGGVTEVAAKIEQHKPDIILLDGAYLLQDDSSDDDDWKALVRVFRGLHRLCLTKKKPMIVTTQSKERVVNLGTISFAKAIAADCDVIGAIEQDDEQKNDKEIKMKWLKLREGEIPGNLHMNWDFDKMDWSPIYIENNGQTRDITSEVDDDSDDNESVPSGVQYLE